MRNGLLTILFFYLTSYGNGQVLLESEVRTDYTATGTNDFFTAYTYDAQGNRLLTRVWDGLDSMAVPISKSIYSYTETGRVDQEVLLSKTGDTLSMVRYVYSDTLLAAIKILRKDGSLRYSDSMLYDLNGHVTEMRRYNGALEMTFFHRYAYDASGRKAADSLYEPSGSSAYVPTQALVVSYNLNGTVGSEASWRISGSQQYLISTVKFGYVSMLLASAATYEGDGTSNILTDSLTYGYDAFGNRTLEEEFDGERGKTHRIVYSWHVFSVKIAARGASSEAAGPKATYRDRSLVFNGLFSGSAKVYGMNGKTVTENILNHAERYHLPTNIAKGRYIVSLAYGNMITNQQITITR